MRLSGFVGLFSLAIASAGAAAPERQDLELRIDPAKPGPVISKYLYGQFAEHLGRGIYEGVWVGEDSTIPNIRGLRKDVIQALKQLHVPLVRWPGGCFADEYHWRDGIGPRKQRPVRINSNWGGVEETNAFGTHEFFDFIELIGAQAYISGNLGTGTPQEMAEWLEYMTADSKSALAELRRKNGREQPWSVGFFGVGNESWGCGGNMRPQYYSDLFKHYATFLKTPANNPTRKIASGGTDEDTSWSEYLTANVTTNMDGVSFHYYTLPTGDWKARGRDIDFTEREWISTLARALRMDELIRRNAAVMDRNDPGKKVPLVVDEWGTWYDTERGAQRGALYQQNTLRDAMVAALTLNIFHAHTDRVRVANIAQMVNVLQAMILTEDEQMLLTPTYHVFEMYVPFQEAVPLPLSLSRNLRYRVGDQDIPAISASAARGQDGKIHVSVVNVDPRNSSRLALSLEGRTIRSVQGRMITAATLDARNTFTDTQAVKPSALRGIRQGQHWVVDLPEKSIAVLTIE
jgi:alpha-N-arabinofuranosidase